MKLLQALRLAYEILSWGADLAEVIGEIGRAFHKGDDDKAVEIANTRRREQAAGRARKEASQVSKEEAERRLVAARVRLLEADPTDFLELRSAQKTVDWWENYLKGLS